MATADSWELLGDDLIDISDFSRVERNPDRDYTFTLLQDFTQEKIVAKDAVDTTKPPTTVLIKESSKLHYYHQNYAYIQNNGQSEDYIVRLLFSALMRRPGRKLTLRDGQRLAPIDFFKHRFTHSTIKDRTLDYTIVRFWDAEDYRWFFAVDTEGRYTFDIDKGDGLTEEQYKAYIKARKGGSIDVNSRLDWADDDSDNYKYVYDAWRLAHPCKLAGITQIPNALRKGWNRLIDNKGDIAMFRMTASPIEPGHIENRLEISCIPMTWTPQEIETYFRKFSLSIDPNYPQFEHSLDDPPAPSLKSKIGETRHLTMLFDPKEHEALFATQLFDYMPISADIHAKFRHRIRCRYGKATSGSTKQENLVKRSQQQERPKKEKEAAVKLTDEDVADGWSVPRKHNKRH